MFQTGFFILLCEFSYKATGESITGPAGRRREQACKTAAATGDDFIEIWPGYSSVSLCVA